MGKIEMIIEVTNSGFSAYASRHTVFTVGDDLEDLKRNILEALNLYFEEQNRIITEADVKLTIDLPQFFEFYKVINTAALSTRIGMDEYLLSEYINGAKKPTVVQTRRILKGVQQVGKELAAMQFFL